MAKRAVSAEIKKAIREGKKLIEYVDKNDGNEAETRRRVERIFESVMGYDIAHLSREHAVKGAGETEHVDFAICLDNGPDGVPAVMVELKRVGVELVPKHLKQVSSYAINAGCEWVLLTNGRDWRIYHVEFGQPPVTKLVDQWNLLTDDIAVLAEKYEMISLKRLRKGSLKELWEKTKVLSPESILPVIVAPESLKLFRRLLQKNSGVRIDFPDFVTGLKRMLNEASAKKLEAVSIKYPEKRAKKPKETSTVKADSIVEQAEVSIIPATPLASDGEQAYVQP